MKKLLSVPFYGLEVSFSGPRSFKLATTDLKACPHWRFKLD